MNHRTERRFCYGMHQCSQLLPKAGREQSKSSYLLSGQENENPTRMSKSLFISGLLAVKQFTVGTSKTHELSVRKLQYILFQTIPWALSGTQLVIISAIEASASHSVAECEFNAEQLRHREVLVQYIFLPWHKKYWRGWSINCWTLILVGRIQTL